MVLTRIVSSSVGSLQSCLLFTVFVSCIRSLLYMLPSRLIVVPLSVPCDAETHAQLDIHYGSLWDSVNTGGGSSPDY